MLELILALLAFVVIAIVALLLRGESADESEFPTDGQRPASLWLHLIPWSLGALLTGGLFIGLGVFLFISAAIGLFVGISLSLFLRFLADRRISNMEMRLVDGIDLIVSSLRAGSGISGALDAAAREIRGPLRHILNELLERIRLGESPDLVLADLEGRVSLESFRLFAFTLGTHWSGGGSLATTLSRVGRTIRDRVDVTRRIRSQAVETQASVLGVLLVTYGLALFMWNTEPERMELFVASELGAMFVAATILMQGIGLFWVAQLTKIEV